MFGKIFVIVGAIFIVMIVALLVALFGGTLVWLLWPIAIPAVFPGLVSKGVLAAHLGWWQSVTFVAIVYLLFHRGSSKEKEKED